MASPSHQCDVIVGTVECLALRLLISLEADATNGFADQHRPVSLNGIDNHRRNLLGRADGSGLVIRSNELVEFHRVNKTVNVVAVETLEAAVAHVDVATQTVGVYPAEGSAGLRDMLATAGAQRVVRLGSAGQYCSGSPHDAMYPLHRFVHRMVDEAA